MKKHFCFSWLNTVLHDGMKKIRVWKLLPALFTILFLSDLSAQTVERLKDRLLMPEVVEALEPKLVSLVSDVHPAIYIADGNVTVVGKETPSQDLKTVYSDAGSVDRLYDTNADFTNIKLIVIKIRSSQESDLRVDLSRMGSFEKLKYILFLFEYEACGGGSDACLVDMVREIVAGNMDRVTILYQISIPQ